MDAPTRANVCLARAAFQRVNIGALDKLYYLDLQLTTGCVIVFTATIAFDDNKFISGYF